MPTLLFLPALIFGWIGLHRIDVHLILLDNRKFQMPRIKNLPYDQILKTLAGELNQLIRSTN